MGNKYLEAEIRKEIEINKEKDKLKWVIDKINNQLIELVDNRKDVVNFILKYREKNLEEYKDDEDKQIDYFNHELYVKEEQFKLIERRLRELTILKESPYFGKVYFKDKYGETRIYIGRFGVTDEEEYEPIIVDWRSPVSSLFYQGKLGETYYNAPEGMESADVLAKRQFIIKNGKLDGMFDSSLNVKDEILQFILSKNTDEKLKDVVMTIQKEQDELIRQPLNGVLVVNGAAGSGKTTIALHRTAYLLYNYREKLQDRVLILGPNSIFMDYISMVLPSLGEESVKQATFREFASEIIKMDEVMDFKGYMENMLSDQDKFRGEIEYKRSAEYAEDIDDLISNLENSYFKPQDVKFYDSMIATRFEIEEMLKVHFKSMPLFKRTGRIVRVLYSRIKDERNRRVKEIQENYRKVIANMSDEQLNNSATDLEFARRNKISEVIAEVLKIKREKLSWIKNPDIIQIYNEYNKNREIIYEDLAPILYMKIKLEGLKYYKHLKHIVIDEAQDYSTLEFKVIRELTGCRSFTIVGDMNQRLVPGDDECAMAELEDIFSDLDVRNFSLTTSYRSTSEIMEYANRYLEKSSAVGVRNGEKVIEHQTHNMDELVEGIIEDIDKFKRKGYESIAVICKSLKQIKMLSAPIKEKIHINVFYREDMIYSKGEILIPSYFAKGLEFDAVIMVDDFFNSQKSMNKLKYIMATRALHELSVYRTWDVS
ncbi:MAG: AAA family ATPase [Clostridium sp.]|uniref:HelD family protein n=1 Tax=Clostridium sp. TaxID=1506 RepID=UPI0025BD3D78|nr:UvrD-helicase domain-containing protein [Clostridium sp.]MCH3964915.1 AAA family ATPase [Clostridium sp.]MCI1716591.1 AAA family ATPase [Clostridium sp.]MCI1800927.1 AAA family ATPase [Clostridium sp.]MCI1814768.1 AAA family ATPase [Clostridium sp.]MCI1871674.1 AAA family ATPase [Clostridium sp.]